MHAPTLERRLESVSVHDLHAHPDNTRGEIKSKGLISLVESIRARGILTPLTVRPAPLARKGFQVLAGHRRLAAAQEVGLTTVPCQVVILDDDQARAVVLLENLEREAPNLFSQSDLVAKLMDAADGRSAADVGAILGKSLAWVARMRAIAGLEPSVRKVMDSEKCDWTVQMVEYFAGLAHDVQKQRWSDVRTTRDLYYLKRMMGEDFHVLKDAPFDVLADGLLPKVGSCATCPKTSARAPGLFEVEDLDPAQPEQLKKATCRDPVCWQAKCLVALRARAQDLAAKTGATPVLITERGGLDFAELAKATGLKVERSYNVDGAKKGEKGAVPALRVKPDGSTSVSWVKGNGYSKALAKPKAKPKEKSKPVSEKERLARFQQRRMAWIVDTVADRVGESKAPPYVLVRALAGAFGSHSTSRWWGDRSVKAGALPDLIDTLQDDKAWAARVWGSMRGTVQQTLGRQGMDVVEKQLEDAVAVYALLTGVTRDEADATLARESAEAMPLPKSLAGAEAPPAKPERAPTRRARGAKGKAAAAGDEE